MSLRLRVYALLIAVVALGGLGYTASAGFGPAQGSASSGSGSVSGTQPTIIYANYEGTTDTTKTVTIPANTLTEAGDSVRVVFNLARSGSGTVDISFGDASNRLGNFEVDLDAVIDTNAENYQVTVTLWYVSDTAVQTVSTVAGHNEYISQNEGISSNLDLSTDEDLVITATNSNITFRGICATYQPASAP